MLVDATPAAVKQRSQRSLPAAAAAHALPTFCFRSAATEKVYANPRAAANLCS